MMLDRVLFTFSLIYPITIGTKADESQYTVLTHHSVHFEKKYALQ